MNDLSSRERMLAALACESPDYVPCCFMVFNAIRKGCADDFEIFDRQLALGIDTRVELPDPTVRFDADVSVRTWRERPEGERHPLLHKAYQTPSGTLTTVVQQTEDWPYGDEVPLFDDHLASRSRKFLVTGPEDLPALRHLLVPPDDAGVAAFRETAAKYKRYAERNGLLLSGGWRGWGTNPEPVFGHGSVSMVGVDALMWLCGGVAPMYWAYDQPEFLEELIDVVATWDRHQLELMLDSGAELICERAWYEGTDFWSPKMYHRFVSPSLREKIALTHEAGSRFGYMLTTGIMPLVDEFLDLGIDVLIGAEPVQDKTMDIDALARRASGQMCVWGGVNAPLSIEQGTPEGVWRAVEEAIATCGPYGGFVLSPVENIFDTSEKAWQNLLEFIKAWQHLRQRNP